MYVIHKGVALYGGRVLTSGGVFGQDFILRRQALCLYAARAMSFLEVYRISRSSLLELARPFETAWAKIRWEALRLALMRTLIHMKRRLVREAGGVVTDLQGEPFGIATRPLLASNAAAHAELAAVLTKTVEDAKALASERQVQMKVATTQKALADAVGNIRGAVMIAYPMGLPDYDAVRQILEEREAVDGAAGLEELEIEKASLWCFNKELQREKLLSECAAPRRAQFSARNYSARAIL